jgi:hypothetical protein
MQSKLSRHEKAILLILAEEIRDEFWGIPVTTLSWMAAHRLERNPGDYIKNRKEWRERRKREEIERFHGGKIDRETLGIELYFLDGGPRKKNETLTEKWRATFSRCLKRLEGRELITRVSSIRYERRDDGPYWVRYVGGRTGRVVLTPQGKEATLMGPGSMPGLLIL